MKTVIRNMLVLLTIALSFTVVQTAWSGSCNVTVTGAITAIYAEGNTITVEETTTVAGIPLPYLAKKLNIVLQEGDYVVITAFQCPSTGTLSACTLSVNGGSVIMLPGRRSR